MKYRVREATNSLESYTPYKPQKKMHDLGAEKRQRLFLAGNRCGKTFSGSIEGAYHLTGKYPKWWKGLRFSGPVEMWAAGVTTESTKEVLQAEYLGNIYNDNPDSLDRPRKIIPKGCGAIPRADIIEYTMRAGMAGAINAVRVQHYDPEGSPDGVSTLTFKSYDQGREKFQGTTRHFIHLDEEPPVDIYEECLMRTAGKDVKGSILITMTPLKGMTEVCERFLEGTAGNTGYVTMSWDEVTHLGEHEKKELLDGMPIYQREAREKGIPALGAGKIYPVPESQITCPRFAIPAHYKRVFGMDFGWSNPTAAVFMAIDPSTDKMYIYDEYAISEQEPRYHASVLKTKGATWIPGVCDPSGGNASQKDGKALIDMYVNEGIFLTAADNSVEAGLMKVLNAMKAGQFFIFDDLHQTIAEFRRYARDENGKVVKKRDHLMDALRYAVVSGQTFAKVKSGHMGGLSSGGLRIQRPSWRTI